MTVQPWRLYAQSEDSEELRKGTLPERKCTIDARIIAEQGRVMYQFS
jgi:hypothetical protein